MLVAWLVRVSFKRWQRLLLAMGILVPQHAMALRSPPEGMTRPLPWQACKQRGQRHFDALVFGDEPAGIMTALELKRQLVRLRHLPHPKVVLVADPDTRAAIGGVLSRSGLAYLDRNQVPGDLRPPLDRFSPSSDLYRRFLVLAGVETIAADRFRVSQGLRRALRLAGIPVLDRAHSLGASLEGGRLCTLQTRQWGRLGADQFVDASMGARLAHLAGVDFASGLGSGPLAKNSLSLGWIFELEGLSLSDLQRSEERLSRRLLNSGDSQAQAWLRHWPAYAHDPQQLKRDLLDPDRKPRLLFANSADSADQRSPAIPIAFHGSASIVPGLRLAQVRLDRANVAILPGRLSINALLFRNDAATNRRVLARGSRPLPWMRPYAASISHFFRGLGARRVVWMPELYVRNADQLAHPVTPLTAKWMGWGGVPANQALGSFTYKLDFRGGYPGLERTPPQPDPTFNFGYRHTLPREIGNLAVLGPAAGYGGLGEGVGRIVELNVSVGAGVAIAAVLAGQNHTTLAQLDPIKVAQLLERRGLIVGRPTVESPRQRLWRWVSRQYAQKWPGLFRCCRGLDQTKL